MSVADENTGATGGVMETRSSKWEARLSKVEATLKAAPLTVMSIAIALGLVIAVTSSVCAAVMGRLSAVLWAWFGVSLAAVCLLVTPVTIMVVDGLENQKTAKKPTVDK